MQIRRTEQNKSRNVPQLFHRCTKFHNMDLILSSPTSLILYVNLLPRKDLVLYPDYLNTFYHNTNLEDQRWPLFDGIPEARPYFSPSLYVRSLLSPPSIMAPIEEEAAERMEEIIIEYVHPIAKEVLRVWLEQCAFVKKEVSKTERDCFQRWDEIVKVNTIEADMASSFRRMFGDETADGVQAAMPCVRCISLHDLHVQRRNLHKNDDKDISQL